MADCRHSPRRRFAIPDARLALILLVGLANVGWGQPAAPPKAAAGAETPAKLVLTPLTAAELALRNSIDLQVNQKVIDEAMARLKQAEVIGKLTGQVTASLNWRGPIASITIPTPTGSPASFSLGNVYTESAALSVAQPIYTGHRLAAQRALAQRGIELAQSRPSVTARATALAARDVSYSILRLMQLADVAAQRVTSSAEHLKLTETQFNAGAVARFEVVQAQTDLSQVQGALVAAQVAVEQAKASLRSILVLPQTTAIDMQEGVPLQNPQGALPQLVDLALKQRPEMKLADVNVRLAEAQLRLIRQSRNASVNAFGSLTQQTVSSANTPLTWAFGFQITKPLFDGGLQAGQAQEQVGKIAEARLGVESTKQQIALDVTQQFLSVGQAQDQLKVAEAGEVNARERLRIANVRFGSGVGLGLEVLDAETALAAAQAAVVNARFDLQTAISRLRSAVGIEDAGGALRQ